MSCRASNDTGAPAVGYCVVFLSGKFGPRGKLWLQLSVVVLSFFVEAQRGPERPREAQRGPERPREAQRGPERPREAERGPEKPIEPQRGTETHKEAQRGPERPMYVGTYDQGAGWLAGWRNDDQGAYPALGWLAGWLGAGWLAEAQRGPERPETPREAERG